MPTAAQHHELLLLNIRRERARGQLDPKVFEHYEPLVALEGLTIAERFRAADRRWQYDMSGDALCRGKPAEIIGDDNLAQVARADYFASFHVYGASFDPDDEERFLNECDRSLESIRSKLHGRLQGSRNVFWLTPATDLQTMLRYDPREATEADLACDILGLVHYQDGMNLVLVELSRDELQQLFVPTFVDAGDNPAFCVSSDPDPDHGCTWRLDLEQPPYVGLPEVVSQDTDLTPRSRIRLLEGPTKLSREIDPDALLQRP